MIFSITYDIPVPEKKPGRAEIPYPFEEMQVGGSFFRPGVKSQALLSSAARYAKRKGETHLRFRAMDREEFNSEGDLVKGARIWRDQDAL